LIELAPTAHFLDSPRDLRTRALLSGEMIF